MTSQIKEIQTKETAEVDAAFLGVVQEGTQNEQPWRTQVSLNGRPMVFKLDTGADVTVILSADLHEFGNIIESQPPDKQPGGPNSAVLPVAGCLLVTLQYKDRITEETIYVVKSLQTPLLGRQAIIRLKLVQRLDVVENGTIDTVKEFPTLFCGLGKLEGEHVSQLREGAHPYTLLVPRRVAISLLPKVKQELLRMEEMGVISPVIEPTNWWMVVVPKKMVACAFAWT